MRTGTWILRQPLDVLDCVDEPYLETALGTLGDHEVLVQHCPVPGHQDFRVFLDGQTIYELGQATTAFAWFRLCHDLGYDPRVHWDLDPALILFRQVVPVLARGWREHPLPFDGLGLPEGLVCLAHVQAAWDAGVDALCQRGHTSALDRQVAACFAGLPLRAVAFQDDPGRREDYPGAGVDTPLVGVYLHLGASRSRAVTLAKATVMGTGGMRWSPWELGGAWSEDGREFQSTLDPEAYLWAAGQPRPAPRAFAGAFRAALLALMETVDPVVERYRQTWPAGVVWHRDPFGRYLNRMIVDVRLEGGQPVLVLDDGTEVAVAGLLHGSLVAP